MLQKRPALTVERASAFNVWRAYTAFAADTNNGTHTGPDFADAVRRHEFPDPRQRFTDRAARLARPAHRTWEG